VDFYARDDDGNEWSGSNCFKVKGERVCGVERKVGPTADGTYTYVAWCN